MTRLTNNEKKAIRNLYEQGVSVNIIKNSFGVAKSTVMYHAKESYRQAEISNHMGIYWKRKFNTMSNTSVGNIIRGIK